MHYFERALLHERLHILIVWLFLLSVVVDSSYSASSSATSNGRAVLATMWRTDHGTMAAQSLAVPSADAAAVPLSLISVLVFNRVGKVSISANTVDSPCPDHG